MNDTLQRTPSAHIVIRSTPPRSKAQLIESIHEQLTVIAAIIDSATSNGCEANSPMTAEEVAEAIDRIFADRSLMDPTEGGPDPSHPIPGRIHDIVPSYGLTRTVAEPGIRYFITPNGALLRCSKKGTGRQLSTVDLGGDLPRLSIATLDQMLRDLDYSARFICQELHIAA